jgi:hypothetical protein
MYGESHKDGLNKEGHDPLCALDGTLLTRPLYLAGRAKSERRELWPAHTVRGLRKISATDNTGHRDMIANR